MKRDEILDDWNAEDDIHKKRNVVMCLERLCHAQSDLQRCVRLTCRADGWCEMLMTTTSEL